METYEETLVIFKRDSIKRRIVGRILQRFEDAGLDIVGMKLVQPTQRQAQDHYQGDKKWLISVGTKVIKVFNSLGDVEKELGTTDALELGKRVYKWSIDQLLEGPVIVSVLGGTSAIDKVKAIVGPTEPSEGYISTIRGQFSQDSIVSAHKERRALHNVVHRSSSKEEARHEISMWFRKSEVMK